MQMKYNIIPVFKLNFQVPKFNMRYSASLVPRPLPSFPLLARTASDGKLGGGLGTRLALRCCELNPCGLIAFIRLLCHSHSTVVKLFPVTFCVVQSKKTKKT